MKSVILAFFDFTFLVLLFGLFSFFVVFDVGFCCCFGFLFCFVLFFETCKQTCPPFCIA